MFNSFNKEDKKAMEKLERKVAVVTGVTSGYQFNINTRIYQ